MPNKSVLWFHQVDSDDAHSIGEHAAKLGQLIHAGIPVPDGFIVTPHAFDSFLAENNLSLKAKHLISSVNFEHPDSFTQASRLIRGYFIDGELSSNFKHELYDAYKKLGGIFGDSSVRMALLPVFGSSISHSYHNLSEIKGESSLIHAIKECWASNFTEMNILHNYHNQNLIKSLLIQKVVEPDKSGKIITIDPETHDKNKIIIKASHGLYDDNVNYVNMPDYYEIDKNSRSIIIKELIPQLKMTKKVLSVKKLVDVPSTLRKKQKLLENEIEELVDKAKLVEKISYFPQEIDWGIEKGKIYFTHTKPYTALN